MSRIPIWHLIPEDPPQCDGTEIDIKLYNCGSILKGSILQSDGDYWWNGRFFEPELIGSWCNEFSEAAGQAGEPGEARPKPFDSGFLAGIEFGFRQGEKGNNLEFALAEGSKLIADERARWESKS